MAVRHIGRRFRRAAAAIALGVVLLTGVNAESLYADEVAIRAQIETQHRDEVSRRYDDAAIRHLPHGPDQIREELLLRRALQVQSTPRPAAPGEDAAIAQLDTTERQRIDVLRATFNELIILSVGGMAFFITRDFAFEALDNRRRRSGLLDAPSVDPPLDID
jgi:hypothetical protein